MPVRLGIEEAYRRYPDMIPGQEWHGTDGYYFFNCSKHGPYKHLFHGHGDKRNREGCLGCQKDRIVRLRELAVNPDIPIICRICGNPKLRSEFDKTKQTRTGYWYCV